MADFDLTQSGQEIQNILDGAAMQTDLTAEIERAEQAEQQLQSNIDIEETRAKAAEKQNADDIDVIEGKIPAAASSENQLADKAFVNSSIATATATYRGAYNLVSDLHLTIDATEQQIAAALAGAISTADNNDYCFVQVPTADATPTQIAAIERYKFNGEAWAYEYTLNNSGFTADQWAALNSGITSGLVAKLATLPTNDELTLLLGGKQNVLTFDNVPTEGSNNPVKSGGVKSAIDSEKERAQGAEQANAGNIAQVIAMIPAAASSENQLADKNFVNSSIATNTATYRGAYNEVSDLSLTVDATHEQIAAALAGAISTADNNDYCFVQVPTADATPTQIAAIERYKFNGTAWAYEYTLNNSGFTADQWAAINSGITSGLVAKLAALPTNDDLVAALAGKQPMLTFDNVPTENSTNPVKSGGVYAAIAEEAGTRAAAIAAIVALIPSAASALNQLADKAFVNSSISTATAVFKGTFNVVADLELNYNASQAQIALMLGSKIASADNNDYCFVQIPTSNETPLEIARTDRYKYNGTAWAYEYTLNNSGFTAAQWAAINSGITSLLKDKLIDLPTATELATQLAAKQNALTFDTTPTEGSTNPVTSDGIKEAIDTETARALAVEQGLQDDYDNLYALYQTLEGGSIIPVAAADWPVSNPQQNVIYRVANSATPTAYSDYMYNGTTTLLLATFTFPGIDNVPTPDSTNLITSGGTFDAIMQNGPAFDLSVYNAVGGTLATYADLSAALTALNALPAAYKKGGMSMKFVQTSDNKYVQYRLMATAFSTTESDWQGVDEEPTVGSDNLIKSSGVFDSLLKGYDYVKATEDETIENSLIGLDHNVTSNSNYKIVLFEVSANSVIKVSGFFRGAYFTAVALYSSETISSANFVKSYLTINENQIIQWTDEELIITSDGYMAFAIATTDYDRLVVKKAQDKSVVVKEELQTEINAIELQVEDINARFQIVSPNYVKDGEMLSSNWVAELSCYLEDGKTYTLYKLDDNGSPVNVGARIYLKKLDGTVIETLKSDYNGFFGFSFTPTITSDDYYKIRLEFTSAKSSTYYERFMLVQGNITINNLSTYYYYAWNPSIAAKTAIDIVGEAILSAVYGYPFNKIHLSFGDSITEQSLWQNKFKDYAKTKQEVIKGYSGQALWANCTTAKLTEKLGGIDFDFITIMFGTNDWGQSRNIGTISDTNPDGSYTGTFYGSLNTLLDNITTMFTSKYILLVTPPYGSEDYDYNQQAFSDNGEKNLLGLTIRDYADAIVAACKKWNVPCFDFNAICGWNKNNRSVYLTADANGTYIHPNNTGADVYARRLAAFCKNM